MIDRIRPPRMDAPTTHHPAATPASAPAGTPAGTVAAGTAAASAVAALQEPILCGHCGRTASNGISCQGMCVADSGY